MRNDHLNIIQYCVTPAAVATSGIRIQQARDTMSRQRQGVRDSDVQPPPPAERARNSSRGRRQQHRSAEHGRGSRRKPAATRDDNIVNAPRAVKARANSAKTSRIDLDPESLSKAEQQPKYRSRPKQWQRRVIEGAPAGASWQTAENQPTLRTHLRVLRCLLRWYLQQGPSGVGSAAAVLATLLQVDAACGRFRVQEGDAHPVWSEAKVSFAEDASLRRLKRRAGGSGCRRATGTVCGTPRVERGQGKIRGRSRRARGASVL